MGYSLSLQLENESALWNKTRAFLLLVVVITGANSNVSNSDLSKLMTSLWNDDGASLWPSQLVLNKQGRVQGRNDMASQRLFTKVDTNAMQTSTYTAFINLLNNYDVQQGRKEQFSSQEKAEITRFLTVIMETKTMKAAWNFLTSKGLAPSSAAGFRQKLYELWFYQYSRAKGVWDSSGFEHVFVGEKKVNGEVSGLHNWIQFYLLEKNGKVDYKGYSSTNQMMAEIKFTWGSGWKDVATFWLGTSPELEMAMYTVCALARPNGYCRFNINNSRITIKTYFVSYIKNKQIIGTAYPLMN